MAGGIFLDLAKAFDTVDHGILLNKLRLYGFRGPVYEWLESYITQRYFYVSINGYNSGKYLSTLGVPQGSVLGPLLFLLYINDIGRLNLHGRTMLFADDTGLFYTGTDPHAILQDMQSDINLISEWFVANRLTVNPSKSHYLFFTKDCVTLDTPITVPSSNQTINRVTCVKYLGLYIDESLSWKTHIEYITKKIAPIVGILYRFRFMSLPRSLKLNLYYSMIHPHISFMNCIWSAASNLLVYGIEVLQRRALKNIFNKSHYTPADVLHNCTGVLSVRDNFDFCSAMYMHKVVLGKSHSNLEWTLNSDIHEHFTRSSRNLHLGRINSAKFGNNSVGYRLFTNYNKIPLHIRYDGGELVGLNSFKKRLKKYIWG